MAEKTQLHLLSASELLSRYQARTLSPVQVVDACLSQIANVNPILNAFVFLDAEGARCEALESSKRWQSGQPKGLLDGVPVSIKDLLDVKGWPTLRGSLAHSPNELALVDSPSVARLRESGAILIGKTTTCELGHKAVTHSAQSGISRNPWNVDLTCGGSSGGAGIAAAAAMTPLNVGSDGGGSVRIPASLCGVVGFKASSTLVPSFPPTAWGTLSHVGPLGRTVTDCALLLRVIGRPDPRDWLASRATDVDYVGELHKGIKGLKIAFAPTINNIPVHPDVAAAVAKAVEEFKQLGAVVEEIKLDVPNSFEIFGVHWIVGAATTLESDYTSEQRSKMDASLLRTALAGQKVPLLKFTQATIARANIGVQMRLLYTKYDLLMLPTLPNEAIKAGEDAPADFSPFTPIFNLTGQPAISVSCGFSKKGLPIGLQIAADLFQDSLVLRAAEAYLHRHPVQLPAVATQSKVNSRL